MTELELCPPDTCVKYQIKIEVLYFCFICHLFEICDNANMTELELCPPDLCMN